MPPGEGLASNFHNGARLPGGDDVEHPAGVSVLRPKRQHRTGNLAVKVRRVLLEIDRSPSAVILTSRVDGGRIFETAQIFGIGFRRDGLWNQSGKPAA